MGGFIGSPRIFLAGELVNCDSFEPGNLLYLAASAKCPYGVLAASRDVSFEVTCDAAGSCVTAHPPPRAWIN